MSIILVIDGDALPSKKEENAQRREEREKNFEKALAAEQAKDSRAARRFYASSCSVTHKMRYMLIKACKELGINFIVAPYEADAQMARLAHTNVVDLVITEDSDMLVYGCPRVCFKVDWNTLQGQEIQLMKDLGSCVNPSFRNFTHDMFVSICIISGCDYCKGVPGIGIKLAHKLVRIHRTPSKIFSALRAAGRMPLDFEESFFIAFRTFRHQRVFCPEKQQIETLYPIAGSNHRTDPNEVWPFLGEYIEPAIASKIADGSYHPSLKIPWSEALKQQQQQPTHQSSVVNDLEIHHRRSTSNVVANGGGRNRRGGGNSNKEKTNVWHSLIYGSKDDSQNSRQRQQSSQPPHDGKENNASSKRDMFSFFPQNKRQGSKDDTVEQSQPPPVPEIYVGNDDSSTSLPKSKSTYVPPAHHRDIPIHFNEYASRLVGRAFKPISRKRKKQELDGTKSSKYVQKIWEKCAKSQRPVLMQNQAPTEKVTRAEKVDVTQGVSRFKTSDVSEVKCHDAIQDNYFRAPIHDTTYQDVERDVNTTTHHHRQYDVLPDFSATFYTISAHSS